MEIKNSLNWMFEIIKNVKEGELTARDQCIIVYLWTQYMFWSGSLSTIEGTGKCVTSNARHLFKEG